MKARFFVRNLFLAFCFVFSGQTFAVDPWLNWKTIESEHLYVHYSEPNKDLAEKVIVIAESVHQRLTLELNWQPLEKTHIVLSDESDEPNGFATPIFFNRTVLFLAPPTNANTLEDFDDWLTVLITHEYTHIIHLDKSAGSAESLRNVFGRFFLLFPNIFQPFWVTEGLATHKETNVEHGIGRGQSALFASMMREEVRNGVQPISHVNLPVNTWPAGTTRYLYGVYFMQYISETYGEEKLQQWIDEYSNNLIPYFINTNASQVFGKDLSEIWQDFSVWLNKKFKQQIDVITEKGLKQGVSIVDDFYRTASVRALNGDVYFVKDNAYERASLMRYAATGKIEALANVNTGVSIDVDSEKGILLTQDEYCNEYSLYKDIYRYDEDKQELVRKTFCARYLYAAWTNKIEPNSVEDASTESNASTNNRIIAVHHEATKFELHLLDEDAQLVEVLWRAKDGEILSKIDVSPDNSQVISSVWRKKTGWNLEQFDMETKQWTSLTNNPLLKNTNIKFYPQYVNADEIMFSMEENDVYNLYRYQISSDKLFQLTNVIGGAFESSLMQNEKGEPVIFYVGYNAQGTSIYQLDDSDGFSMVKPSAAKIKNNKLFSLKALELSKHKETSYSLWKSLRPRWWFPSFNFSNQRSEVGLITAGSDALAIHNYSLAASYDFKNDIASGSAAYGFSKHLGASIQRSNDIYLDASSNFNRLRVRDTVSLDLIFPDTMVLEASELRFSISYDVSSDEQLAANAVPIGDFEDNVLAVSWFYDGSKTYPLSISANDGYSLRLVAEDSDALGSDFSGQVYTFDINTYIRTGKESVLSLRFVQGWGTNRPDAFELGGVASDFNALDMIIGTPGTSMSQRDYALRGYDEGLPQLRGRRLQLLSGEWHFPLQRVERGLMSPPLGLMQWFGTVFAETGSAYQDSPERYYSSVGGEVTADINLFYALTMRLSLGYAHGFDSEIGGDRLYLSAGSRF